MIVQFFRYGNGMSKGPLDYLLGKDRERDHAKILSGNEQEIAGLIDSSPYAKKYTAGCLSFYEDDFSEDVKKKLMSDFEKCLFPGMNQDQYRVLWIEHKDKINPETGKARLELNFLIPNTEILTGKRLQPFFHHADLSRVDLFKKIINFEHDLHDPNDPLFRQAITSKKSLPKSTAEIKTAVDIEALKAIESGLINDRISMKKWLTDLGLEITKETKKILSIKNPNDDEKARPIKLTGAIYEQDFRVTAESAELTRKASERYRREARQRHESDIQRYTTHIEQKSAELERKYRQHEKEYTNAPERSYSASYTADNNRYTADKNQISANIQRALEVTTATDRGIKSELNRIERLEPSNSRSSEVKKNPFYIKYSPDFSDLYFDYQRYLSRLRQQREIQRTQANQGVAADREPEIGRSATGFSFEQSRVEEEISIHQIQGLNDDSRSPVIADHRAAADATGKRLRTLGDASFDNRAAQEIQQSIGAASEFSGGGKQQLSTNNSKIEESTAITEFIKKLGEQLKAAVREPFTAFSKWFEHREPSKNFDKEHFAEHGTSRDKKPIEATNRGSDQENDFIRAISTEISAINPESIFSALDHLDRRKELRQEQEQTRKNDRGYDSPSPF
jgi:hypothetical protein